MQQQQLTSIIEYSNAVHVQPPTKTICVGTYRSFTTLNFSQLVMKDIKVADGFSQGLSKPLKPQSQVSRSFNLNGVNPVIAMMFGNVSAREIYFLYSCNLKKSFLLQLVKSSCRRNQTMREEHILDSYLYSPTNFMYICKIQCRAAFFCKNTYYCAN